MIDPNVGFIGSGNMAEALIKGLLETKVCNPGKLFCADVQQERLDYISKHYHVKTLQNNHELLEKVSVILLAVKPQQVPDVLKQIHNKLDSEKHIIISIAAGLTTAYLETLIGKSVKVVRVMPNTPATLLEGAAAYCLGSYAKKTEGVLTQLLFEAIGLIIKVDESLMNAVTALSGSGPAYIFKLCEMMINGGVDLGLDRTQAEKLSIQTIFGAALMLKKNEQKASALRKAVTSPGGTTEAALHILETQGFETIFSNALQAARDRGYELAPQVSQEKN